MFSIYYFYELKNCSFLNCVVQSSNHNQMNDFQDDSIRFDSDVDEFIEIFREKDKKKYK